MATNVIIYNTNRDNEDFEKVIQEFMNEMLKQNVIREIRKHIKKRKN